ncbi:MAG: DsbA family protein [Solirubrobacterales bacterium]|nr:DsbA family protein [Solirubrobacterales bacterium]
MPTVAITEFTDPGCPFAFSAEPHRLRLRWLFGDQLEFSERMVGLADTRQDYLDKGFTPEKAAKGAESLAAKFGMPMSEEPKPAVAATVTACRAVVAARQHATEKQWPLLRRLRHLHFAGPLLDDPQTIRDAASFVGLDPDELEAWMGEEATERALREDMLMARDPTPAALALKDKLASTPENGWRYTCPSYEFRTADGAAFSAPGMQSSLAYETALANVAPGLERRAEPEDVTEVLAWAGFPVATQEVAEVCGISHDEAHEKLEAAGAVAEPVGRDAFWTLAA